MVTHNLNQFANRMRKRAADIEPAVDEVLRKVAVVANQTVIMATPVDTGRARANWQVSINTPITEQLATVPIPAGKRGRKKRVRESAQAAMDRNKAVIQSYRGGEIILQNNVPYIGALNAGSSAQAAAGFVERALMAAARAVSRSKVLK